MLTIIEFYVQAGLAQGIHLVPIPRMQLYTILLGMGQRRTALWS
ncbi:MAG: hypothetical protein WCQ69_09675 [Bacteroidales bacterium]|nr:hypothetical protein [Bacteroidales bacterium]MDD2831570.1 hypothetical protein [Bacteroidales bacterium]MDD3208564.1 hypothetical protein [Bacteroidales bacterium]MDD3697023.1 hypothetical protein [Bacteroidales bacterium]MDD4167401.1 hypothetical protein [Bacteroidales bacterium]